MSDFVWTKTPPTTVPGWYWVKEKTWYGVTFTQKRFDQNKIEIEIGEIEYLGPLEPQEPQGDK